MQQKEGSLNKFGYILRWIFFLKRVIVRKMEEKIEVTGRWKRRRRQLLDDVKDKIGYWTLKEEALVRTLWGTHFFVLRTSRKTDCGIMIL
jgi:hypothetical protein